jgi:hypothetical protein
VRAVLCGARAAVAAAGRYFRRLLVGYFKGIDSERGLEWRCADSLSLREFLRLSERELVPDHSCACLWNCMIRCSTGSCNAWLNMA